MTREDVSDRLGVFISSVCIFHCTVVPILLAALPTLGLQWLNHNPQVHFGLFLLMLILASAAFAWRFTKHRSLRPGVWMAMGVLFVGLGHFVLSSHQTHENHGQSSHHHGTTHHATMAINHSATTMAIGAYGPTLFAIAGGIFLIIGHRLNQKLGRQCCRVKEMH